MDVNLAKEYHKRLAELFSELQVTDNILAREPIVLRMQNVVTPLFVVHSGAAQHISEALAKLNQPDLAIVNASHHTINQGLQQIFDTIQQHTEQQFVIYGDERVFAKPVAMLELNSLKEKERLFDEEHNLFVHALDAPENVQETLLRLDTNTLRPVLQRLGFPHTDALVFFRTKAQPSIGKPIESMPSLKICKLRSGIPVSVMRHRVL